MSVVCNNLMDYIYMNSEKSAVRFTGWFLRPGEFSLSTEKQYTYILKCLHKIYSLLKNCRNNSFLWLSDQATIIKSRIYLPVMLKCTGKMHI